MNMETKHTPGPWILDSGRTIKTQSGDFYITYGTEKKTGNPLFRNFCELDENARLIASAPELLAALEGLFEQCAMVHKHWGDGANGKQADAAIAAGRAAIARAKGE